MEVCLSSGEECECVIDEAGTLHLTTVSKGGTSISSSTSTSGGGGGSVDAAAALRERQLSHAAASTSTSASTSSAATDAATASTAASDGCGGGWEWLTEQQQEVSGDARKALWRASAPLCILAGHARCTCACRCLPALLPCRGTVGMKPRLALTPWCAPSRPRS